jgi:hypothetical protein
MNNIDTKKDIRIVQSRLVAFTPDMYQGFYEALLMRCYEAKNVSFRVYSIVNKN